MVDFRAIIETLKNIHFYDVILPFILVYAIVFAILEKSGIFAKKDNDGKDLLEGQTKNINSIIAFVFGLFVVASIQTVLFIESFIVNITIFIIFILVVLVLLGFIFGDKYGELLDNKYVKWTVAGVVLLVATAVLITILGVWDWVKDKWDNTSFGGSGTSDTFTTILIILALGFVMYWISGGFAKGNKEPKKKEKKDSESSS